MDRSAESTGGTGTSTLLHYLRTDAVAGSGPLYVSVVMRSENVYACTYLGGKREFVWQYVFSYRVQRPNTLTVALLRMDKRTADEDARDLLCLENGSIYAPDQMPDRDALLTCRCKADALAMLLGEGSVGTGFHVARKDVVGRWSFDGGEHPYTSRVGPSHEGAKWLRKEISWRIHGGERAGWAQKIRVRREPVKTSSGRSSKAKHHMENHVGNAHGS